MIKKIYGEDTNHLDIADSLKNIGLLYLDLGIQEKAL